MAKISTFAENRLTFFLRPARELIFSLKHFTLIVLTGKNHPCPGKNLYVEKNDLKLTKNRFFGCGFLTTSRKSNFLTTNIDSNYNKVYNARNDIRSRVFWFAQFICMTFMIDTINYWVLDKKYTFFRTFLFALIIWWILLAKILQSFILVALGNARRIEKLTHQPKELVNQNCDKNQWKRRGIFLIISNTPVLPVDRTKLN